MNLLINKQLKIEVLIVKTSIILHFVAALVSLIFFDYTALLVSITLHLIALIMLTYLFLSIASDPKWIISHIYLHHILLGLFALFTIISTFLSINSHTSLYGFFKRDEGLITFFSYYMIFLYVSLLIAPIKINHLINFFLIIAIPHGIYGILQRFTPTLPGIVSKFGLRIAGLSGNPNFFGSYVVLISSILMVGVILSPSKKQRQIFFMGAMFYTLLAIYSGTRSAWVAILFSFLLIGVFSLFLYKKHYELVIQLSLRVLLNRWIVLGIANLVLFLIVDYFEGHIYLARWLRLSDDLQVLLASGQLSDQFGASRGYIWKVVWQQLPDYWLHGCGVDALGLLDLRLPGEKKLLIDTAHNEFLHIAITQGIPAFIAYVGFIISVLYTGLKNLREKTGKIGWYHIALIVAFCSYLVQSFFNISTLTVAPFYWMIAGLICVSYDKHQPESKETYDES